MTVVPSAASTAAAAVAEGEQRQSSSASKQGSEGEIARAGSKMIAAVTPEYSSDVSRKNRPSQRSAHASQPMNTSPERKAAAYSMRGRARLLRPLRNFHGKRTPRKREHDRAEGQIARRRHAVREGHPEKADAERSRKERSRARAERVHAVHPREPVPLPRARGKAGSQHGQHAGPWAARQAA